MSQLPYPNESSEYRAARDELLKEEQALVEQVRRVAEIRRQLPSGGQVKEDYLFNWANDGNLGDEVRLSELFGDKSTLLLYNFMYGPNWDNPCLSCTSLMDGFDRTAYQVSQDAAFCGIASAPAKKINDWASIRGWTQINLLSAHGNNYQVDYHCQGENADIQWPKLHVFIRRDDAVFHFWGTELPGNHVDTVWPYWNLMDFTPEGRPDRMTPPQAFRSRFLEDNFLYK